MTLALQNISSDARLETSDVSIIRREFVELTGDHFSAVILNQLLYWTLRVKDFDYLLEEERQFKPNCNVSPRHGWIYKTAEELNMETMLGLSHPTMRKYLKLLIDQEWIDERSHPTEKWNRTTQYRVNLRKLQEDLLARGLTLPGVYLKEFACFLKDSLASKNRQQYFRKVEETSNVRILHSNERNLHSDVNSEGPFLEDPSESAENPNVRILHSNERNLHSDVNSEEPFLEDPSESAENSNVRILHSNERNLHSNVNSEEPFLEAPSESAENPNVRILHSNVRILHSNVKNLHSYTYTENTSENINREHQLDACAREARLKENFSDVDGPVLESSKNSVLENFHSEESISDESVPGGSESDESIPEESVAGEPISAEPAAGEFFPDNPVPDASGQDESLADESGRDEVLADESLAAEMLKYWELHVVQNLPPHPQDTDNRKIHLTKERGDQLEGLLAFHFQNDMGLWERFCLRVKASSFLMGGGANGWTVRLDWILRKGSVSKVLEGNYDDSKKSGQQESLEWKLEKLQANPLGDAEKAAILASIKDPVWRKWCERLAEGVRLNEFKMVQEPLSVFELQQIAHAWFLEVEDNRLIWIGSSDQRVLNKIDDLRLKISWVFAETYPKATTFRTRLASYTHHEGSLSQAASSFGGNHE